MNKNIKLLYLILFLYIAFFIYMIYFNQNVEHFNSFIEGIKRLHDPKYMMQNKKEKENSDGSKNAIAILNKNELKEIAPEFKEIYVTIINKQNCIFSNAKKRKYMRMMFNEKENREIHFLNVNDEKIGYLYNELYEKYTFYLDFTDSKINVEFYNDYREAKIYLDNDDDNLFYIKNNGKDVDIYYYQKKIGKIENVNANSNKYMISVEKEYKEYLNYLGIAYIIQFFSISNII